MIPSPDRSSLANKLKPKHWINNLKKNDDWVKIDYYGT